jgi:hypothetical protein
VSGQQEQVTFRQHVGFSVFVDRNETCVRTEGTGMLAGSVVLPVNPGDTEVQQVIRELVVRNVEVKAVHN